MKQEAELQLLSHLQKTLSSKPDANQRYLAQSTNLSLGMTNALLRRFTDKGWLYMKKISARNIQYILTPDGINELAHRSSRYFKRTARLLSEYKDCVRNFICEKKREGFKQVALVGVNDVEFLFDYACSMFNLSFIMLEKMPDTVTADTVLVFSDWNRYMAVKKIRQEQFVYIFDVLQVLRPASQITDFKEA